MAEEKKQLTIHEKWEIDQESGTGGLSFRKNPDAEELPPLEIEDLREK
jgi:hypothetical protein